MNNLLRQSIGPTPNTTYFGRPAEQLFARLDTLLLVLKDCKQEACRNPYSILFPAGQVSDLTQAMHLKFDAFFEQQPKVAFAECIPGHIVELEGPQRALYYAAGVSIYTQTSAASRLWWEGGVLGALSSLLLWM